MLDSPMSYFALASVVLLLGLAAPPLLAARKGYSWYLWILGGLLGLVVLAFLPFANKPPDPPEASFSRRRARNNLGAVVSALGALGIVFFLVWLAVALSDGSRVRESDLSRYVSILAYRSPVLATSLLGIVLALAGFSRSRKGSGLVLFAGLFLLFDLVVLTAAQVWLPGYLMELRDGTGPDIEWIYPTLAVLRNLVEALGICLLLLAAFVGRSEHPPTTNEEAEAPNVRRDDGIGKRESGYSERE